MQRGLQDLVALCKRRGFIFPTSEIYGGFANSYDYGPLGIQLKKNLLDSWWKRFVVAQPHCYGLDSATLLPPKVWEMSGHLSNFSDPLVDCKSCGKRFRADHIVGDDFNPATFKENVCNEKCPCGKLARWGDQVSEIRDFNLMFETSVGPVVADASKAYFRPETAQGAFLNFSNIVSSMRPKLPFGIAQVGKAFRNEVTPGNFIFRTREFEQMELEWFCNPDESPKWFDHWLAESEDWLFNEIGMKRSNIRLLEHEQEKLAHYSKRTVDLEYNFPFGWGELWGIANRGTYDLSCHGQQYHDLQTNTKFVPAVIEPALGLSRLLLAVLCDAYAVEQLGGEKPDERVVLRLAPQLAPITWAVLPLISKDPDQITMANDIFSKLSRLPHGQASLDASGVGIGKRYRRHDEIGTPFCITIDYESKADNSVTIRERDSMTQRRISVDELLQSSISSLRNKFDN